MILHGRLLGIFDNKEESWNRKPCVYPGSVKCSIDHKRKENGRAVNQVVYFY